MSSFITKAACQGNRPNHLLSYRYFQRQRLMSRLLKERGVARFVVAPTGYGKTGLALEYADTIFAFAGVFWVNCKSPCFIRDLDDGVIADTCLRYDPKAKLVVFEDMPYLDDGRATAFSQEIDALLNHKCEVLVTCVPSCDSLGKLQKDRVSITAKELLLDDEELSLIREGELSAFALNAARFRSCRVPVLVWAQRQTAVREFLARSFREEAPSDLLFTLMCTAVLGTGSFTDLALFGPIDRELVKQSLSDYPHIGFGDEFDSFDAPPYGAEDIAFALRGTIDAFVKCSSYGSRQELVRALAGKLMEEGRFDRACDVIRFICPMRARVAWIAEHAHRLVGGACFLHLLRLAESVKTVGLIASQRSLLVVVRSICYAMLGDNENACKCANKFAFDEAVLVEHRVLLLSVLAKRSSSTLKGRAIDELATIAARNDLPTRNDEARPNYTVLAQVRSMLSLGVQGFCSYWTDALRPNVGPDLLSVAAAWFYDELAQSAGSASEDAGRALLYDCAPIEEFVRGQVSSQPVSQPDFYAVSAGLAMEMAHSAGVSYCNGPLPTQSLIVMRNVEINMMTQQGQYSSESAQSAIKRENWLATHPDGALNPRRMPMRPKAKLSVPTLNIKTFGKLEVSIGGQKLDQGRFKGTHVRSLIVLLAAGQGREVSRDALCASMWPNSDLRTARKSFYSVWSKLRRALVLPDGTCPYLVKHSAGCSFDESLVQSDIARLEEICRTFMFEQPDFERWSDLLIEIDCDFSCDLLPSETANDLVVRARDEYRAKLIDALVVASAGIAETGNMQRAIWCAQLALDRDDTREDAYLALMRAQAGAGQRSAAMATYRKGMHVLVEKLGLDPSREMMELYRQLLDSDDLQGVR